MSVEPNTLAPPSLGVSVGSSPTGPAADWSASTLQAEVLRQLEGADRRLMSLAPGRLDIMGGIAADTGALAVQLTTADHACVAVAPREDGCVALFETGHSSGKTNSAVIAMDNLVACAAESPDANALNGQLGSSAPLRCVVGTLVEYINEETAGDLPKKGISIAFGSTLAGLCDVGGDAALAAATLAAIAGLNGTALDPEKAARISVRVGGRWSAMPIGSVTASCCLQGKPHELMQLQYDPCVVIGAVPIPDDLLFIGLDVGESHAQARAKYERARTAGFMGRLLIDRIIRHDGTDHCSWDGCLSRLSIADYVERFRDRIPTKIKGRDFLDRFGETGDPDTRIDASTVYKVRSRTEHHIYEHTRACQFVECLARAVRSNDERAYHEAGELMYASHWSYGQRCGLGALDSDRLVGLLRKHGQGQDVFGARVAGRGCGGHVVAFIRAGERALGAVDRALNEFGKESGRQVRTVRGSSPGALLSGVRDIK